MKRKIELLSPARNADCGMEAVRHGADAVYIGGPAFGARAAAGNPIEDIGRLCNFAHTFDARIYVTLNTILTDKELLQAEKLIHELYKAGCDALIIQDMGLLQLDLPPIPLHASTQTEISSPEKARFLEQAGFSQLVLARELSLRETAAIRNATTVPLEAFVHGALCVSYSGHCYASQYCFGRSANRGECAQLCRLAFDLTDAEGRTVVKNKHLLSLRDMNRSKHLEEMMDAGISSFKIEGRLKDAAYVKNITAFYRQRIDEVLQRRTADYERSSFGKTTTTFQSLAEKSFNRGFSTYFLHGRTEPVHSFDTPKATGERVGRVATVGKRSFTVCDSTATFAGGDGLCFIDRQGKLQGFRVNKAEGSTLFPATMPPIYPGMEIFRNTDHEFEKQLSKPSATRRLRIRIRLRDTATGYTLEMKDESGREVAVHFRTEKQAARTPQKENIVRQLCKLGDTPFEAEAADVEICLSALGKGDKAGTNECDCNHFIPASVLAAWRRTCTDKLLAAHRMTLRRELRKRQIPAECHTPQPHLTYMDNVMNRKAREFYLTHGAESVEPAFEAQTPKTKDGMAVVMECRHCLRYALGFCPAKHRQKSPWKEPLALRMPDGRSFPLSFDCKRCVMQVKAFVAEGWKRNGSTPCPTFDKDTKKRPL